MIFYPKLLGWYRQCTEKAIECSSHRRTSRGGGGGARGAAAPSQLQKILKYFGQNADDSGKCTREKIL